MWSVLGTMAMSKRFELPLDAFNLAEVLFPEIMSKYQVLLWPKVIDSNGFRVLYYWVCQIESTRFKVLS
jgi:hypothetical protein